MRTSSSAATVPDLVQQVQQLSVQNTPQLPSELIDGIVKAAWRTAVPEGNQRWKLYCALSLVSRQWRAVVHDVATRHVVIDSLKDLVAYDALFGTSKNATGTVSNAATIASRETSSHLYLVVDRPVMEPILLYRGFDPEFFGGSLPKYFSVVSDFVPRCSSATIVLGEIPERQIGFEEYNVITQAFQCLLGFSNLTSLVLCWIPHPPSENDVPTVSLPSVTHLRLRGFPGCWCPEGGVSAHKKHCVAHGLLSQFPGLRHLHMEDPVFLKFLQPPKTLETLTLDAPPLRLIAGRAPFSSIQGWNIGAALNRRFFQPTTAMSPPRRITVYTGVELPLGWTAAARACEAHGVQLERIVVFTGPIANNVWSTPYSKFGCQR